MPDKICVSLYQYNDGGRVFVGCGRKRGDEGKVEVELWWQTAEKSDDTARSTALWLMS